MRSRWIRRQHEQRMKRRVLGYDGDYAANTPRQIGAPRARMAAVFFLDVRQSPSATEGSHARGARGTRC